MVITSSSTLIKKEVVYVDAYVYVWREEIDGAKLYIYIYILSQKAYVCDDPNEFIWHIG